MLLTYTITSITNEVELLRCDFFCCVAVVDVGVWARESFVLMKNLRMILR